MTIAEQIRDQIARFNKDYVFTASDFDIQNKGAVVKSLQRLASAGEIFKLAKGKYYKPRSTEFGTLKPSAYQIAKDFIEDNGKIIGYITGYTSYNAMGLTTQISSQIQIGTNKYRRTIKRDRYMISFIVQPNKITSNNIGILRILDAIRFIREIPATTPNEACLRLKEIIKALEDDQVGLLVKCALNYTNYVRALCGAILEDISCDNKLLMQLHASISSVTRYKLPISDSALPTKQNWNIYEPTRKLIALCQCCTSSF